MLTLPTTLPRRSTLDAHAITCCWWPSFTFNLPPNVTAGTPVPPHPFLIFILFFCPSVLFCFRSLCVCALISPTPLLCHQLGPSVSKSWTHCACLFFFLILLTNMYAWTLVAFHKRIHCILTYICTINLWLPLADIVFLRKMWMYHSFSFKKGGPDTFGWYYLVQNLMYIIMLMHSVNQIIVCK